jgi:RNA polymerase sigma-70 factor (ECF subfamily)
MGHTDIRLMMGELETSAGSARSDIRLRRLFETHRLAVLAYCMRRASRWDAHDAAAEVFAVAWRRIDDVPEGAGALPWLYAVARRVLANIHRGRRRQDRLRARLVATALREDPLPEPPIIRGPEYQWVLDAVGNLPELDREILLLVAWESLSHREVGDALGMTEAASRKRLERARRRLEKELDRIAPGGAATIRGGM